MPKCLSVLPQCRDPQRTTYGAARKSTVQVGCYVDANPNPTRFRWQFQARGSVRSSSGGRCVGLRFVAIRAGGFGRVNLAAGGFQ